MLEAGREAPAWAGWRAAETAGGTPGPSEEVSTPGATCGSRCEVWSVPASEVSEEAARGRGEAAVASLLSCVGASGAGEEVCPGEMLGGRLWRQGGCCAAILPTS